MKTFKVRSTYEVEVVAEDKGQAREIIVHNAEKHSKNFYKNLKVEEKHEEVCDNTDHVGDIAPNVKEVEMKEEFDSEKVRWCKDCRERNENMIKN